MPFKAARNFSPLWRLASSIASRVSFVNLQKLTFQAWEAPRSMKMFAPAQKTRSFRLVMTTVRTSGCSKRIRWTASASSMSTPRSYEFSFNR